MSEEAGQKMEAEQQRAKKFPCPGCGAQILFSPGSSVLKCPYCEHEVPVPQSADEIHECDFRDYLAKIADEKPSASVETTACQACGATVTLGANVASDECPYCGTDLVVEATKQALIRPESLLPFKIDMKEALGRYRKWVDGLWFAPGDLKTRSRTQSRLTGIYVPYWTYDANTVSYYTGQRGEDYYVTETYTTTENGKTVTKTRQVKKTRWYSVSGTVFDSFDDVLILASRNLPAKYAERLEPWDLEELVSYADDYLAGFRAETYQVDLAEGFGEACEVMEQTIRQTVCRDIGGDHQRIHSLDTQHNDVTFKHILLPVWMSAYRYNDKIYRFLVNGRTGEVQGERPWSWIKIALAILAGLGLVAAILLIATQA